MKKKSIVVWVALIALPIPLLVISAVVQIIAKAANGGESNAIVNIMSLLVGIIAVLMMLGLPLWIIMLIKTTNDNKKLTQEVSNQSPTQPQTPLQ